jgi:two-component system phosphate regulon sensor histidine kinase PhoR
LQNELRLLSATFRWPDSTRAAAADGTLQRRIVDVVAATPYRLSVIALDGRVIADSSRGEGELAKMESHADRPEVVAALARGEGSAARRSETTAVETIYAARLVRDAEGNRWVLRLAKPLASLAELERQFSRILLLSILAAALLVLIVSWWLTRSLFAPLSELIGAADAMGRGDYRAAFAVPEQSELARLGVALRRIAERADAQIAAVAAERDHLRATVAGMTEGVLVTDSAGRTQLVNPAFAELFGVAAGAAPAEILELAREPALNDLLARALRDGGEQRAEIERLDPMRRTLAVNASPLAGGQGAVLVARDITESERLHRMRRDFVANVSHELRTPLAAIRGFAETLTDGAADEPETALRFSQRILDQCRRLGALLDDLLTLSRLEGAAALTRREAVDLRELAQEAIELVGTRAAERSVSVTLAPPATGEGPTVEGDADGLLRLISNLLENAVKYNRPGGTVRVRLAREEASAVVEVEDTGIGIPADSLPRIFERFYRVDKGRSREEGGTGLGLAIVKHVAQAHGGRVEVESRIGEGSRFRVFLPLGAAAD